MIPKVPQWTQGGPRAAIERLHIREKPSWLSLKVVRQALPIHHVPQPRWTAPAGIERLTVVSVLQEDGTFTQWGCLRPMANCVQEQENERSHSHGICQEHDSHSKHM